MPIFRTDLYVKITVDDYNLMKSSEALFQCLQNISELRNVQMTKVRIDREKQGKIKIEEWYEITGSINVPEGGRSFWVISKESSENETYNFFMRIDRNTEDKDYETAQRKASDWVIHEIIEPLESGLSIREKIVSSPIKLSKIVKAMGESK
ncbi:MAG: hypothetical protein ACFFDJ_10450 [Candidatus Odinarchaeota archaeon]